MPSGRMPRKPQASHRGRVHRSLPEYKDERVQHELAEMKQTHDLDEVDDDVEQLATLLEWQAPEREDRPKTVRWYITVAATATLVVAGLIWVGNFLAALSVGMASALLYYIAQRQPALLRYRLMVDGVAINNILYHYRDIDAFNIIYRPGEVKTIIFRSKQTLAPLIHMEIGDADPMAIRDILLEFLPENDELEESLVDVLARRFGF
jgi:hypothetical protein